MIFELCVGSSHCRAAPVLTGWRRFSSSAATHRNVSTASTAASDPHRQDPAQNINLRPPPRPRPRPAEQTTSSPGTDQQGIERQRLVSPSRDGVGWAEERRWKPQSAPAHGVRKYNIRINVQLSRAQSLSELFGIIEREAANFNNVNASTALHRIAKHSSEAGQQGRAALRDHGLVQLVTYLVVQTAGDLNGISCSNIAYASAVLELEPQLLLSKVVKRLPTVIHQIGALEIGLILWACVKSQYNPPGLFEHVAPVLVDRIRRSSARDIDESTLCRIPWAYASFDEYDADLFRTCAASAEFCISSTTTPQGLSMLLWAYGKTIPPSAEAAVLLSAITDQFLRRSREFNWQDLANVSWAAARVTLSQSRTGVSAFLFTADEAQEAAATPKTRRLFACISERAQELMPWSVHDSDAQSISNIAWAFATLSIRDEQLFSCLATQALPRLAGFTPQAIANLVGACAKLGFQNTVLYEGAAKHMTRQVERGATWGPQAVATVLYAYAVLNNVSGLPCLRMIGTLARHARQHSDAFDAASIAAALWGLTVARHLPQRLLDRLWVRAAQVANDFTESELHQLAQVQLAMRLNGKAVSPDVDSEELQLLQAMADQSWQTMLRDGPRIVSALQQDVMAEVRRLRLPWVMEASAGADYSLDISLPEHRMGIEVDGPWHFTANTLQPLGPTVLKRRLLAQTGWRLVSIPFFDWMNLEGREEKQQYIAKKLRAALAPQTSAAAAHRSATQRRQAGSSVTGHQQAQGSGIDASSGLAARPAPVSRRVGD